NPGRRSIQPTFHRATTPASPPGRHLLSKPTGAKPAAREPSHRETATQSLPKPPRKPWPFPTIATRAGSSRSVFQPPPGPLYSPVEADFGYRSEFQGRIRPPAAKTGIRGPAPFLYIVDSARNRPRPGAISPWPHLDRLRNPQWSHRSRRARVIDRESPGR